MGSRRADERTGRTAPDRHRAHGPAAASGAAHPLLELQRSAGNHAVARLMALTTIARTPTKATPAPQRFSLGENGGVFLDDGDTSVRVGTVEADETWVAVDEKDRPVALDSATIGTLAPGPNGPDAAIVRARRATVKTTTTTTTPAVDPDVSQGALVKVKLIGTRHGVIYDIGTGAFGTTLLDGGKSGWTVVDFGKLPQGLRTILSAAPSARIALDSGGFWSLMSFHLKDERTDRTRWVAAKAGVKGQKESLEKDAEKLPPDLRERFSEYLGTVTAVMAHEGTYGSRSPGSDPMASIGIFQWGMNKSGAQGGGSSMGMFFRNLKRRAEAVAQNTGATPTPEQKLYIDAWEQCRKAGLDVDVAGTVSLNGKQATGGQVESVMAGSGPMAKGALKTYQLVAAMDWIEKFRETMVRPGPSGASRIGNGYAEKGSGSTVMLERTDGGMTFHFSLEAPDITANVGDLLSSGRSTAIAVTLGVNRPHYVEAALWLAVGNRADPKADVGALLSKLVTGLQDAEPEPGAKAKNAKKPKTRSVTVTDVEGLGKDAAADWAELQRLIWPAPQELDDEAEKRLAAEFERRALTLYKAGDARKFHRERRFATAEAAFQ